MIEGTTEKMIDETIGEMNGKKNEAKSEEPRAGRNTTIFFKIDQSIVYLIALTIL